MTGRKPTTEGEEFPLLNSEYADDAGVLFPTQHSLATETPKLIHHFERFGMEIHLGNTRTEKASKSEILFAAKPRIMYDDPDTYDGADLSNLDLGNGLFIPIVAEFVYLGSTISRDCTDEADVDARIDAAGNAFGALREKIFSSTMVTMKVKKFCYVALILSILLYGSECWTLTEKLYNRLRNFHHRCLRNMCRVTRLHTRKHSISNADIMERTGISSIDSYVSLRQLRWAGHVARMDFSRLPRKMLSSWVTNRRPRGAPRMTYGRGIRKALKKAGIALNEWSTLAQDRLLWRERIKNAFPN